MRVLSYYAKHRGNPGKQIGGSMDDSAWKNRAARFFLVRITHTPCDHACKCKDQKSFSRMDLGNKHCAMQQSKNHALNEISNPKTKLGRQAFQKKNPETRHDSHILQPMAELLQPDK